MSCNKCKNKKCGCNDQSLTVNPNFSNDPTVCPPDSEPCSEVFDMACICYQGPDIVELDIQQGDRLDEILQKLVLATTNPGCANFEDALACQSAINLMIANLTDTSFDISWDAVPAAVSYVVEFKDATTTTWFVNPAVAAPIVTDTIPGLTPDTIYDVRVNTVCASGNCYSLNIRIRTLPTPA
jgi:hypothetical protein